jgi:hypothetical protein
MKSSARLFLTLLASLALAPSVHSQMGGGGIGVGSLGFRATGSTRGIESVPAEEAIPGRWRIEFRVRRHSEDPEASGIWRTVTAEMYMSGLFVTGRIRDDDFPGDFTCSIDEFGRCMDGKLRFHSDNQDWQVFSFIVDREGYRAEGWATFTDIQTGAIREYELAMRKR